MPAEMAGLPGSETSLDEVRVMAEPVDASAAERFAAAVMWRPEYEPTWDDPRRYGGFVAGRYIPEEDFIPAERPTLLLGTWEDPTHRWRIRIWVTRAQWEGPPIAEQPFFQAALIRANRTQQIFEERESLRRLLATLARTAEQLSRSLP